MRIIRTTGLGFLALVMQTGTILERKGFGEGVPAVASRHRTGLSQDSTCPANALRRNVVYRCCFCRRLVSGMNRCGVARHLACSTIRAVVNFDDERTIVFLFDSANGACLKAEIVFLASFLVDDVRHTASIESGPLFHTSHAHSLSSRRRSVCDVHHMSMRHRSLEPSHK
jgi:hypothetical protein